MNYEDWEKTVPDTIKSDSLWKMSAYRLALFLSDVGWYDVTKLMQDRRTLALSDVISWQDNLANLLHDVPLPEL